MAVLEPRDAGPRLIHAAAALDATGLVRPAALLVDGSRVRAVGPPTAIGRPDGVPVDDLGDRLILPALVNAHVHLDLWSVGDIPLEAGFDAWLAEVRRRRPTETEAIRRSVRGGIEASLRGGVVAVGDIAGAGSLEAATTFAESPLGGTSFVEVFGIERRLDQGLEAVDRLAHAIRGMAWNPGRVGLSPHAPYSCDRAVFAAAARTGLPVSSHLSETPEESTFIRDGGGPLVDLLRQVGSLSEDDSFSGTGLHPIDWLSRIEPPRRWLLAHVNYLGEPGDSPEDLERRAGLLRDLDATVVFCPRAAERLGHPRPGRTEHPWKLLRSEGVRVALGTDGRPCLGSTRRLSTLDDVRHLLARGADPVAAIEMATTAGAAGLGLAGDAVTFAGGAGSGLLAVEVGGGDPIRGLVAQDEDPTWLLPPDRTALATSDLRG